MIPGAYLVLAVLFGAMVWALGWLASATVAAFLVAAVGAGIVGSVTGFAPYPWTDLVGATIAITGGVLLGRGVPARFRPMAILLVVLGALDSVQVLAANGNGAEPGWHSYTMFVVAAPWLRSDIGVADLLLVVAMAEHFRRRLARPIIALAPGVIGLALADAFTFWHPGGLPLVPFLFAGFVLTEPLARRFVAVPPASYR